MGKRTNSGKCLRRGIAGLALAGIGGGAAICHADPLVPYGGPTSGPGVSYGQPNGISSNVMSLGGGTSIQRFGAWSSSTGNSLGTRVLRWDATGSFVSFQTLGAATNGYTDESLVGVTSIGQVLGWAEKYSAGGTDLGPRPVRWDAAGNVGTEYQPLFSTSSGYASAIANGANEAGMVAGEVSKYTATGGLGARPVRWAADGTPTVLGDLGTDGSGYTDAYATGIDATGTTIGSAAKHNGSTLLGFRAVRWAAGSITPVELGNLGTDPSGIADVRTRGVNASGIAFGTAQRYVGGQLKGTRAVAWLPGQTAALELANLGTATDPDTGTPDYTESNVYASNSSGELVGWARKYGFPTLPNNRNYAVVPTIWTAQTGTVQELQLLHMTQGVVYSEAAGVNDGGVVVGRAYDPYGSISRAVYWRPDGSVVDLNELLAPSLAAMWDLNSALSISNDGWVTGEGVYWPNGRLGTGQAMEYTMQLPEPTCLATLGAGTTLLLARRRRLRLVHNRRQQRNPIPPSTH
jgi:hypothetical protein